MCVKAPSKPLGAVSRVACGGGQGIGKKPSLHDNLLIHADNLAALKAPLPTYHNNVKYMCRSVL